LVRVLAKYRPSTALLFCETRDDCDAVTAFLNERGAVALALHGQMEQRDRDEVLLRFANGSASLLVATNVAARGLDIPNLPAVVITELSRDPESHLHRIGRTGRAGETGVALSIVAGPKERARLKRIEQFMGERIERKPIPSSARGLHFLSPPNCTVLILSGRKDKLRKGDVLGALVKDGGVPTEAIGRIDLMDHTCAVAVAQGYVKNALGFLRKGRVKKKHVRAILLGAAPEAKDVRPARRPKKIRP
jgi:ATP-independent RNA helicase DbpA